VKWRQEYNNIMIDKSQGVEYSLFLLKGLLEVNRENIVKCFKKKYQENYFRK